MMTKALPMSATNPTTHTKRRSTTSDMRSSQDKKSSVFGRHCVAWWRRQQYRDSGVVLRGGVGDKRRIKTEKIKRNIKRVVGGGDYAGSRRWKEE